MPINIQAVSRLVNATTANDTDGDGALTCADRASGDWQTTQYSYDAKQRLIATTLPDGVQLINDYDGDDLKVSATYFRDTDGTDLPQLAQSFGYDDEGNLTDVWDAKGNHTQTAYDAKGLITSVTNALGEQTLYTYTADNLTQIEVGHTAADGEGQVTQFRYDDDNNLKEIQRKDDTGTFLTFETYTYDSAGNRLSVTDAENRTTGFGYDALGRLTSTTDALGNTTAFAYDSAGNLTKTTDALLRETRHIYDPADRLIRTEQAGIDPPAITRMAYDAAGNTIAVTDANDNTTRFTYDGLSRQLTETKPLGQTLTYVYDSRDRLDHRFNARGHKIDYSYAPWGPVTREEVYNPDNTSGLPDETITYAYDLNGNLTETAYDDVQPLDWPLYTITYDALDREDVTTVGYIPNLTVTLDNDYDRYGNRSRLTVDDGEILVHEYDYDQLNRLVEATLPTDQVFTLDYYADDSRKTIHYPNGVVTDYVYWPNGPVEAITITKSIGERIEQFAYTYDDVLNVKTMTDGDGAHAYQYGGLDRLTRATHPEGIGLPDIERFGYDKIGNREDPDDPAQWIYDSNNRLLQNSVLAFSYDADGNLQQRGANELFDHSFANQLRSFQGVLNTTIYENDPLGPRVAQSSPRSTSHLLWDGNLLLGSYGPDGVRDGLVAYLPQDFSPIQLVDEAEPLWVCNDQIDAPRLLVGVSEDPVWRSTLSAFGSGHIAEDVDEDGQTVVFDHRFPGQHYQADSGLHYNLWRSYDPTLGRYIEPDPIGFFSGSNFYVYADNYPNRYADPTGECPWCIGALIGGGIDIALQLATNGGNWRCVNWGQVGVSAALGAVGGGLGAAAGRRGLTSALRGLSNGTKGRIGEGLSTIRNFARGSRRFGTQVRIPGQTSIADSVWRGRNGVTYYVESKFGTAGLTRAQKAAERALGSSYRVERWSYPWFGNVGAGVGTVGGGAAGGVAGNAAGGRSCGCP